MRDNAFNGDGITVYGPNMNLVKDPRWGRAQEVYSEDPRLTSALTVGYVTGIQGAHLNGTQKDASYMQAGACCKHYVAYDVEGNGPLPSRVFFDAQVSGPAGAVVQPLVTRAVRLLATRCSMPSLPRGVLHPHGGWYQNRARQPKVKWRVLPDYHGL